MTLYIKKNKKLVDRASGWFCEMMVLRYTQKGTSILFVSLIRVYIIFFNPVDAFSGFCFSILLPRLCFTCFFSVRLM